VKFDWPTQIFRRKSVENFQLLTMIFSENFLSVEMRIRDFSLPRSLVSKLVIPPFGKGKFVRAYSRCKGKLECWQEVLVWLCQTKDCLDVR
jgi:hypothetical protein